MMNMNTNTKLLIILVLFISVVSSLVYIQTLKETTNQSYKSYEKTANEISIIKSLKEYYGDKKSNKRKIYNIMNKYNSKIIAKKEDKNTIEFTISKLSYKEIDSLNKEILSSGIKINKFALKRIDAHTAELFCKVVF